MGKYLLLMVLLNLTGCAGYHFRYSDNPWQALGVKRVGVPLFQNDSLLLGINHLITNMIIEQLQQCSGLEVVSGEGMTTEALLIGIIHGPMQQSKALATTERIFLDRNYSSSLGKRRGIYLPRKQSYQITVDIYLIEHPTTLDLKLLRSKLPQELVKHKVLLHRRFSASNSIVRALWGRQNSDSGGVVNYTQSEGSLRRSYLVTAQNIAKQFKEMMLYAF